MATIHELSSDIKPGKYLEGWIKNNVIQGFGVKVVKHRHF